METPQGGNVESRSACRGEVGPAALGLLHSRAREIGGFRKVRVSKGITAVSREMRRTHE